jgi:hypothetical protein
MTKKKVNLKRFKDKTDKFVVKKNNGLFDLPARVQISASSGFGKTSLLLSLMLSEDAYLKDFEGENIYIFSPMINDAKLEHMCKKKKIPDMNIYTEFDEHLLSALYDKCCEEYETEKLLDETPQMRVIIFDDVAFEGSLASKQQKNNIVNKLACNSRKHGVSLFFLTQDYFQLNKVCRNNLTGLIMFNMNNRSLEQAEIEHNYLEDKKSFKEMVRGNLKEKHDFVVVNYSNNRDQGLYLDKDFQKIG